MLLQADAEHAGMRAGSTSSPTRRRAPAREVYGFVLYLITILLCGVYLMWLLVPVCWLPLGVPQRLFPRKYWALAIPASVGVCLVFLFGLFVGVNLMRTPSITSWSGVKDSASKPYRGAKAARSTPDVADMSLCAVNRMLYPNAARRPQKNGQMDAIKP